MRANKSVHSVCFPQDAIFIEQPDELQLWAGHKSSVCPEDHSGGGGERAADQTHNSMEVWQGGRDGLASILLTLFPNLKHSFYYVLTYLEQPVCHSLGCLFWYQLFICLAFCAVLLENLAMEHLTWRGSKLKHFHSHTELLHVSRGLRVSSSKFYDGIVISTIPPNRYSVSIQKT